MVSTNKNILMINMASGFGGGEFQTEQLILSLKGYNIFFFGKSNGKLKRKLQETAPSVKILNCYQLFLLCLRTVKNKNLIIHAQDGRGAHIAGVLKRLFNIPIIITRHVSFPFKRKSSSYAYRSANAIIGVSKQITELLSPLNENSYTIYGCIKPLKENQLFEKTYFVDKTNKLSIAHIGNLQPVKNFELTIQLAANNPDITFYIVGSGELEHSLKHSAKNLCNVIFIPFTEYIGSVFKNIDLQIIPSHSEGLGGVILEGYKYKIPVLAHSTGGIPEIVEDRITGYLSHSNNIEDYQYYLDELKYNSKILSDFKTNISNFLAKNVFSADRMAEQYQDIYRKIY
ncbi:glycosyltransferase family 4 protein [Ursidibacter maritimus]|uniref:glycosyltransferase family 4 protein n=1 Tax=Ursidibacter maritimus TaxID=1331689 RepID=UPI001C443680|nr:glycosyltransferase family 4 protein [Ursidibacter maritimus]MBV6541548.1 glycosyltransferase family 4 protein [Ursidibacter maritimus]